MPAAEYNPTTEVTMENPRAIIKVNFHEETLTYDSGKRHTALNCKYKYSLLHYFHE